MIWLLGVFPLKCSSCEETYLVVSEPDPIVEDGEHHDVVDERFQPSRSFWYREGL
jgi:hypothetical protein